MGAFSYYDEVTIELEDLIGSCLVFGIPGTTVTPEIVRHFKETHAGGLILYRINFESPQQIIGLIKDLENALERRLLVTVDHEGGRVIMFRDGVTVFPDSLAVGAVGDAGNAQRQGEIEAQELRRLGVDVNFAPVLDVLTETYSPNIGIRSYGKDPQLVARLGTARIKAMQAGGLSATAKHFPGLGSASLDPHLKLPVISSTWAEMEKSHLVPFVTALTAGVDVVMSSHPLYPNLDPAPKMSATFSRRIIRDYLRGNLGYEKVISSDDLEMGAIRELCSVSEAAVRAAAAGHDMLLSCHDPISQRQVFEALGQAYRQKVIPVRDLEASVRRIEALKTKRPERFAPGPAGPVPGGAEQARVVSRRAATVLKDKSRLLPLLPSKAGRPFVIFPALSSLASRIMIERELEHEAQFVANRFSDYGLEPIVEILPIEPSESEIEKATARASQMDLTVFFCFDAHMYPSNAMLLSRLQASAKKLVVVLMRDPYDVELVEEKAACVTAFGYRICQLEAAIDKIFQ